MTLLKFVMIKPESKPHPKITPSIGQLFKYREKGGICVVVRSSEYSDGIKMEPSSPEIAAKPFTYCLNLETALLFCLPVPSNEIVIIEPIDTIEAREIEPA